jgi:hypothetical protein
MIIIIGTVICSLVICACSYIYYEMFIKKNNAVPFDITGSESGPETYIIDVHPKENEKHKFYLYDIITKNNQAIAHIDKTYVTYKHKGSTYKICLNKEIDPTNKELVHKHRIITAYLFNEKTKETKDISDTIKMFQGPNYDFHKEVQYASSKLIDIIDDNFNYWTHLVIDDITGNEIVMTIHDYP